MLTWHQPSSLLASPRHLLQLHRMPPSSWGVCPSLTSAVLDTKFHLPGTLLPLFSWPTHTCLSLCNCFLKGSLSRFQNQGQRPYLHTPEASCTSLSRLLSHITLQLCLPVSFTACLNSMRTETLSALLPLYLQNLVHCLA